MQSPVFSMEDRKVQKQAGESITLMFTVKKHKYKPGSRLEYEIYSQWQVTERLSGDFVYHLKRTQCCAH